MLSMNEVMADIAQSAKGKFFTVKKIIHIPDRPFANFNDMSQYDNVTLDKDIANESIEDMFATYPPL